MNILVTGGAGFIGSHVCESLLGRGHHLAVVDSFDPFYDAAVKRENLAAISESGSFDFLQVDVRDAAQIQEICRSRSIDAIVHLAARPGVRQSLGDPVTYESINIGGTIAILEAARHAGVRKIVFASSSSVYGPQCPAPFREHESRLEPVSPYGLTKVSGEQFCRLYAELYGIDIVCLRLFSVYGPRLRPDLAMHRFASAICSGEPLTVFGTGETSRDYTFVSDVAGAVGSGAETSLPGFHVINIGNSNPIALSQVIARLEDALGRRATIRHLPEQPGEMTATCADVTRARALLSYHPSVSFEDGIVRFARWFMETSAARAVSAKAG